VGHVDHGDVDVAAAAGLAGSLQAPSGLVAAGLVGGVGDMADLVPPQRVGRFRGSVSGGGLAGQRVQHPENPGVGGGVGAGKLPVPVGHRGVIGAKGAGLLVLFGQRTQPPL